MNAVRLFSLGATTDAKDYLHYLQDWSTLCADIVFTCDTFHSNLRKTVVLPLKPSAPKWNKERPKTTIRRYGL